MNILSHLIRGVRSQCAGLLLCAAMALAMSLAGCGGGGTGATASGGAVGVVGGSTSSGATGDTTSQAGTITTSPSLSTGGVGVGGTGTFDGGVGVGGTGTFATGPIRGFGSIVVGGVRYDDSAALIERDDGTPMGTAALGLGAIVEVDAQPIVTDALGQARAVARRIRLQRQLLGPVTAVDVAAGTLSLLGQTVRVGVDTVLGATLGSSLAAVVPGTVVEVYALFDAARGSYTATRIDRAEAGAAWQLEGPVAAVDSAMMTMRLGNARFEYARASQMPGALMAGQWVRLRITVTQFPGGTYQVFAFGTANRLPELRDEVEIEGRITSLVSPQQFTVEGIPVDASQARIEGDASLLRVGARIEVDGRAVNGVLVARKIEFETDDELEVRGFEFEGRIDSVDWASRSFMLRGTRIGFGRSDLRVVDGRLADLAPGRKVDVKAVAVPEDRSRVDAVEIKFD